MSYVSIYAPLPPNSLTAPLHQCTMEAKRVIQGVEGQVAKARKAASMIAPPSQFQEFGPGVTRDAARSQQQLIAAHSLDTQPKRNGSTEALATAPKQLPLNVTEEEYSGCSIRGIGALKPIPIAADQQRVSSNMPEPAPVDTGLLTTGNSFPPAPRPAPAIPGSGTFAFVTEARRPVMYAAIVPRGMGAVPWGDSTLMHPVNGNGGGISSKGLLIAGLIGLGLWGMSRKGRR